MAFRTFPLPEQRGPQVWLCNNRADFGEVKGILSDVFCIRVAVEDFFWLSSVLFQVFHGFLICLKDTGLGAGFDCHITKCHTVTDAQRFCTLTGKLHHLVVASVCADLADDGEDQVSRINALRQFSYKIEFTLSGTSTQEVPVTMPYRKSVQPTPVPNAPSAP